MKNHKHEHKHRYPEWWYAHNGKHTWHMGIIRIWWNTYSNPLWTWQNNFYRWRRKIKDYKYNKSRDNYYSSDTYKNKVIEIKEHSKILMML